ncbi:hypothetical protein COCNU_01G012000 [Cocos nucifera]|uniref:Uncharacterized protein n=1 Tax=Cocos nucifera TaxID=13894 RepID=A0A8K0MUQ9_COCNU|nr:hypothetical protein COCNU_01G012000 [Cocos nucifera]
MGEDPLQLPPDFLDGTLEIIISVTGPDHGVGEEGEGEVGEGMGDWVKGGEGRVRGGREDVGDGVVATGLGEGEDGGGDDLGLGGRDGAEAKDGGGGEVREGMVVDDVGNACWISYRLVMSSTVPCFATIDRL